MQARRAHDARRRHAIARRTSRLDRRRRDREAPSRRRKRSSTRRPSWRSLRRHAHVDESLGGMDPPALIAITLAAVLSACDGVPPSEPVTESPATEVAEALAATEPAPAPTEENPETATAEPTEPASEAPPPWDGTAARTRSVRTGCSAAIRAARTFRTVRITFALGHGGAAASRFRGGHPITPSPPGSGLARPTCEMRSSTGLHRIDRTCIDADAQSWSRWTRRQRFVGLALTLRCRR